ncbi:MAG: hypothetical protein A3H59_01335 [Candidatus Jacksonbacteria bacterium RIFCSPLOWO2_02_FULL_43_9]|nr:MAG: hypothetical protein UV70_C0009G0025 [Parcubacteria group bacterium GW2011_GWA2_43_13]OGY69956.1 MAG: hypothetical protein A3B94_00875 [Candidatus Jacksonbacteria bacterium RIFCSPHIGHO2_02_FULL_43_10]OGY70809.1 MAG: hypothetical protein A2986_00470 [Candidatus Jacksonbacteria bacterium RIFCSPLOWO2_01_FULL_44_13]OGY73552.1 MAG: hypothetical protein A3H59_01335 [Candidatus Jacksonbacteria bacterium RIFCSPLOWO2_02_FULL_43_9]HAZ17111.1 hypothetical protein [Candidatus Jacksonbacteria bacter
MSPTYIITAAGGNATAIVVLEQPMTRAEYETRGKQVMSQTETLRVEQAGFLIPSENRFEMAGGEFCGNAARAAAILLVQQSSGTASFTMSGFAGVVEGTVQALGSNKYQVECRFSGMIATVQPVTTRDLSATMVDLGGIVHVVVDGMLPTEYEKMHKTITTDLGLADRDAVGVIWIDRSKSSVRIHPVVWVRSVDSFFYETSCGSGSIATAAVTGLDTVVQPTGEKIQVGFTNNSVTLKSEMEIVHVMQ